eukprot:3572609-Rhodomonas_salina.1
MDDEQRHCQSLRSKRPARGNCLQTGALDERGRDGRQGRDGRRRGRDGRQGQQFCCDALDEKLPAAQSKVNFVASNKKRVPELKFLYLKAPPK